MVLFHPLAHLKIGKFLRSVVRTTRTSGSPDAFVRKYAHLVDDFRPQPRPSRRPR